MNPNQPPNPYQQPQYPQQPGYPPQGGYEFTAPENSVIGSCATWTMILGGIEILEGASKLVGKHPSTLGLVVHAAMGVMLIVASQALRKVVNTQGQDVPHLMKALDNFGQVLLIRIILLILALVIVVVAVVAVLAFVAALK